MLIHIRPLLHKINTIEIGQNSRSYVVSGPTDISNSNIYEKTTVLYRIQYTL